ncbi:DUF6021 family protein [Pseudomonas sp. NPDC007930]|uniref:DUF6021 family protein n=1 Tax=Pseudomonas sp. NPDC007930 TaxID=3364417 RepID=UPI0036E1E418
MKNPTHDKWPTRDGRGDARGLPGYPKGTEERGRQGGRGEQGFDPDSPNLTDPQIDPPHPPQIPGGPGSDVTTERRAPGKQYPPYSKP